MFYRVATYRDFEKADKAFADIPEHIKALLKESEDLPKACKELRGHFGYGMMDAKRTCQKYLSFLEARSDYNNGKIVYTEY